MHSRRPVRLFYGPLDLNSHCSGSICSEEQINKDISEPVTEIPFAQKLKHVATSCYSLFITYILTSYNKNVICFGEMLIISAV
jgi:hypothetical protein